MYLDLCPAWHCMFILHRKNFDVRYDRQTANSSIYTKKKSIFYHQTSLIKFRNFHWIFFPRVYQIFIRCKQNIHGLKYYLNMFVRIDLLPLKCKPSLKFTLTSESNSKLVFYPINSDTFSQDSKYIYYSDWFLEIGIIGHLRTFMSFDWILKCQGKLFGTEELSRKTCDNFKIGISQGSEFEIYCKIRVKTSNFL